MAAKKSKKSPGTSNRSGRLASDAPLDLLQNLLSAIPDELKLDLLSSLMGGLPERSAPKRAKRRSKAEREIERLVEAARRQESARAGLELLKQAAESARSAIGNRFENSIGRMGDSAVGERYLDVKLELAEALKATGQREAALTELEDVYRLDPSDPMGARLSLLESYLDLDRVDDAQRLLEEDAPEHWSAWNFGRVLVALRRGERGGEVDEQLKRAHEINPLVLSLLLGERMPSATLSYDHAMGADGEAQQFAAYFLPSWKNTPGAISWLRDATLRLKLDIVPPDEIPTAPSLSARDYAELPEHKHATWVVLLHETGKARLPGDERPKNHWLVAAFSSENDLIGFDIATRKPTPRTLWESLTEFMLDDQFGGRPATMLVHPAAMLSGLQKCAAKANVEVRPLDRPEQYGALLSQLTDRMLGGAQASESLSADAVRGAPLDVDEVWEAAVVQLDRQLTIAGHVLRPAVALVMSRVNGTILWHELFTDDVPESALAGAVRMAIARPGVGGSRRPRQVVVRDNDEAVSLAALADEAGFVCIAERELPLIADAVARLTEEFLGGEPKVVLTKGEGTTPQDLERYYTAAAAFFRAQPWKCFGMDELIAVDRREELVARQFALVMGQSGITLGVAIYERLEDVKAMFASDQDFDEDSGPAAADSFSVMFGEANSIAPVDLDAIEQFGWPIATPEAYPDALRIHPGPRVETPSADELRFVTATMQAITGLAMNRDRNATSASEDNRLTATRLGTVESMGKQGQ